jgi:hypothetical protein
VRRSEFALSGAAGTKGIEKRQSLVEARAGPRSAGHRLVERPECLTADRPFRIWPDGWRSKTGDDLVDQRRCSVCRRDATRHAATLGGEDVLEPMEEELLKRGAVGSALVRMEQARLDGAANRRVHLRRTHGEGLSEGDVGPVLVCVERKLQEAVCSMRKATVRSVSSSV